MSKASCKTNQELSEIINGLEKQMSAASEELKLPSTAENPEAKQILSDAHLACQKAIVALDKKRQFSPTTLLRMSKEELTNHTD